MPAKEPLVIRVELGAVEYAVESVTVTAAEFNLIKYVGTYLPAMIKYLNSYYACLNVWIFQAHPVYFGLFLIDFKDLDFYRFLISVHRK